MKVLFATSRFPFPLEKGDKLRAYNFIKCLSERHEVHLFAIAESDVSDDEQKEMAHYCKSITIVRLSRFQILLNLLSAVFSGLPFQVGYFVFDAAKKKFAELNKSVQPDVQFFHLIRTAEYALIDANTPKMLDYMDAFSVGVKRRLSAESIFKRWLWKWEFERLLQYENKVFPRFGQHTIISEQDKKLIPIDVHERIAVVPNGVEFPKVVSAEKTFDIIFAGNMSYPPNVEAVVFLVKKIMPLVWQKLPAANVVIAGANPSLAVKNLASEKIKITGWVNSIQEYMCASKILVAPMLISIGLQNKLLEAMASRVPCVTSKLANNALQAIHGKQVFEAEKPEEYAQYIVNLLQNSELHHAMSEEAYRFAAENYSWKKVEQQLCALLEKAVIKEQ